MESEMFEECGFSCASFSGDEDVFIGILDKVYGGKASFTSATGEGTTVTLRIPIS